MNPRHNNLDYDFELDYDKYQGNGCGGEPYIDDWEDTDEPKEDDNDE